MDNIKMWTGLPVEESVRMTENRDQWRKYVHGVANSGIEDGYKCSLCEVAEPVVVMFGTWTCVRPRNHVLRVGAHWRHLANAVEWQFGLVMGRVLEPQLINC